MNSKFFLTLSFLSTLVLGCSSGGGSNTTKPDDPNMAMPENPIEREAAENPIEPDQGYKVIEGVVYLDGEVVGTIETDIKGNKYVADADGNTLAYIQQTGNGYVITINHAGSGEWRDHYYINKDSQGNWTIDWAKSVVDHGFGVDTDTIVKPEPMSDAQKKAVFKQRMQTVRNDIKAKNLKR